VPASIVSKLKPTLLGAALICVRLLFLDGGSPGICMGQQNAGAINARSNLSGKWLQNNERSIPPVKNKARSYEMTVEASEKALRVRVIANSGHGERRLDLNYQIGGKELVYTGMDGDEYHSKVHWDGDLLVFTTVEHERGRLIPSQETWTLIDSGNSLQRVKVSSAPGEESKNVYVLERLP
jgi:hypothetical protein